MADLAQRFAVRGEEFGRERAFADPGGVGLDDAPDVADLLRRDARAGAGAAGDGAAAGDVRISAVVDIEQRGLGAFAEDFLARLDRVVDEIDGVADEPLEVIGGGADARPFGVDVELLDAVLAEELIVLGRLGAELFLQPRRAGEVDAADAGAVHLVGVGRPDAAPCGADLLRAGSGFAEGVGPLVVLENELGAVRKTDVVDGKSLFGNRLHLFDQPENVDHEAVADDVDHVRPEDAGGNQVEHIMLAADFDGMARVVAALKADDHIHIARQNVDQLAFSFIAPLGSDQNVNRHISPCNKVLISDMKTRR